MVHPFQKQGPGRPTLSGDIFNLLLGAVSESQREVEKGFGVYFE